MSPGARDVTNEDATAERSLTGAGSKSTLARYVATPLRSASKVASALVGGFFFAAPETEEKDARAAGEAAQARAARGREAATGGAARRLLVEDENGSARTTHVGLDAMDIGVERARPMSSVPASMTTTTTTSTDSPTPFTEIKEFLRRGQMDRERMSRPVMASAVKPVSPFERAPSFEANVTPVRERVATAPAVTPSAGSPGYASMRRSYVVPGTPSLLGAQGRTTVPKPAILEPQTEAAALTPTRMSLKREREVTFLDLERERARNTTPRRLESSAGPGAEARAPECGSPVYQTPTAKTVTSAVTTDTAKRILQTLDRLASTRTATPLGGSTAGRTPGFAARPTPRAQAPSPVGSAFGNEASATKLTPTSATFVQTPKSGVSFAASPMPFVSSSASGRAPLTPYPTSAGEEYEEEIEARVFDFGTDETRYSKGHKAPAGPVASVSVNFQFGTDDKKGAPTPGPEKTKLTFKKPTPAKAPVTAFTAPPPVAANKVEEAPKTDKPVMNLWSADFLAKNQEHQKKVQAAIEEEEGAGAAAPAKPSPFAPAPAAGDKPAFSFGIPAAGASSAASSGAAFSFGSTAPAPAASTGAAPFSFGVTAPAKPAEPAKPAGESGLLAFLGGSSQDKASDAPAVAPTFTFGAPPKSPDNVPVKALEPAPAFTFGGSTATTEATKPASGGFTFGGAASAAATTSTTAAPFSFGAKPADKAPEVSAPKSELSASAPAFTFGSKVEATPALTPAPAAPFSFGGANAGDTAPKPAAFTFGATAAKADDKKEISEAAKPAAAGFSFGGATAPAFGTSTGAASDNKPESAPAFSFGASAQASSGAASGGFSFGASAPAVSVAASGGGFVFGASSDAGKPASANPFGGGLSVNTKPATSVFGNAPKADEQPNTPEPMSPFETSKSPTIAGASLFGGTATSAFPASTAPSASPFGGSSSFGASTGANPFGGASATPAFGAPAAPASGASNLFGSTSVAAPAFGGVAANPFGASAAPTANPFGANPAPSGGFSMGGGDAAAGQGGRKPRKFKRPPKRN